MSIELTNDQVYCIYELENWWNKKDKQVFEISGSPGTGKTFLVKYFIERLGLKVNNVLYLAYTGKAASILQQNGLPGKTIHSQIYEFKKKIKRDETGKIVNHDNGRPVIYKTFELIDHLPKKIKLIVIDEASMVDKKIAEDILSFGIPIITLGDLNQLPPVYGEPYFLKDPDVILTKIMRQKEGDPIIWLSQELLAGRPLRRGVYGNSAIIAKEDITDFHFKKADIVLTGTNRLRYNINNYFRETLKGIKMLEYPHVGEKMVCRKNNWSLEIPGGIYLTNGTTGFVDRIDKSSFNKRTMKMDFRPDFSTKCFKNVTFDYNHLYSVPGSETTDNYAFYYDKMEFAYALTVHSSQGSQWKNVLYLHEYMKGSDEDNKKLLYTALTRAVESVIVVM